MKHVRTKTLALFLLLTVWGAVAEQKQTPPLYQLFSQPGMEYRPMVRWWWNGDKITAKEILRELDLMKEAGLGGVEINPIAFNGSCDDVGIPSLEWLSPEWIELVKVATDGCKERGMTADIIIGSGWPFGAEFLSRDEQLQMLTVETFDIPAGERFSVTKEEILKRVNPQIASPNNDKLKELLYLRLMPKQVSAFTPGENLDAQLNNNTITVEPQADSTVLYCFVKLTGYMAVINGAPGAKGPVVNHFSSSAVRQFLNRMSKAMYPVIGKMGNAFRATFVDSFELEGANWDPTMLAEFKKRRGYALEPYLPYVIVKVGHMGNPVKEKYGSEWSPEVKKMVERVKSDFNLTQRELFKEGFTDTYNAWCRQNNVKSRVQAYGIGLHSLEASMDIDIPECETWFKKEAGHEFKEKQYYNGRPYSMINKFVASASFLAGKNMVSCEEITNTNHVFFASLEDLKLNGDMSNLSGVNRSIYHGFNYSPPEAPFPGWIRYGAYINENNTWWKYMRLWNDYKARVSALLSNTVMQADIAILHPLEDLWSKGFPQRDPFPEMAYPNWEHNLWEAIHQNGNGCDYISEKIIAEGKIAHGMLTYNNRRYNTVMLMEVESLQPKTALALARFVKQGGKVICIGKIPHESVGLQRMEERNWTVETTINDLRKQYPDRFCYTQAPGQTPMREWFAGVQRQFGLTPYVRFSTTNDFLSQNYYRAEEKDIFFLVNYSLERDMPQRISFPGVDVAGKQPWIWDAETGQRYRLDWNNGEVMLNLGRGESCFLVFDSEKGGEPYRKLQRGAVPALILDGLWTADFRHHVTKEKMSFTFNKLQDLGSLPINQLKCFAGEIDYTQTIRIDNPESLSVLDAGTTLNGVTELIVNGQSVGVKWYGNRLFDVKGLLKKGDNRITIRVTTILGNYCKSLKENRACQSWTAHHPFVALGLDGTVTIY